jgi:hypothetical protein
MFTINAVVIAVIITSIIGWFHYEIEHAQLCDSNWNPIKEDKGGKKDVYNKKTD